MRTIKYKVRPKKKIRTKTNLRKYKGQGKEKSIVGQDNTKHRATSEVGRWMKEGGLTSTTSHFVLQFKRRTFNRRRDKGRAPATRQQTTEQPG